MKGAFLIVCMFAVCHAAPWSETKCRAEDCPVPSCVDPLLDDEQCCLTCPRGENCRSDGELVSAMNQNQIRSIGGGCWATCHCPGSAAYVKHGRDTRATCRFWCRSGGNSQFLEAHYGHTLGKK